MKLSIVIPVYNTEKYLARCITSLFEQQIPLNDFEIILINDGSTDASLEICLFWADKYKNISVITQENKGQSTARNAGLKKTKGNYIYFIDSDDYLDSGYLGNFLSIAESEELDFVGFGLYQSSQYNSPAKKTEALQKEVEGDGLQIISKHSYYNGSCWYIFKKDIAENLFFEDGRVCEDIIFTTELLLRVKKGRVYKNTIYCYFNNNSSTIKTKNPERSRKLNNDMFYVAQRFSKIIKQIDYKANTEVFNRLKIRQESYVYFAIVRFVRSRRKHSELNDFLLYSEKDKYPAYPIKYFKGYTVIDKFLIKLFNNHFCLKTLIVSNRLVGSIFFKKN